MQEIVAASVHVNDKKHNGCLDIEPIRGNPSEELEQQPHSLSEMKLPARPTTMHTTQHGEDSSSSRNHDLSDDDVEIHS